jgi:hypothetical protein
MTKKQFTPKVFQMASGTLPSPTRQPALHCSMTNPMSHLDKVGLKNIYQTSEWVSEGMSEQMTPRTGSHSLRELYLV